MAKQFRDFQAPLVQIRQLWLRFVNCMFEQRDGKGLGLFRILFGLCMFLDVFQERGLEDADIRFGNPNHCFFPLFAELQPVSVQVACVLYSIMWIGTVGILFGYKFRVSCFLYLIPYVYFFLLDKSRWNNHSYLFGLTVILLSGSRATSFLSLDNYFSSKWSNANRNAETKCPNWNYFILKFQYTLLYFFAAVKKVNSDWLSGYSMRNISKHKVLYPVSQILGEEVLDYYVIHLGGFAFDLSAGFLLNFQKTKPIGLFLSFLFHGLNSQLFEIGMFPYVCLASLLLFCSPEKMYSRKLLSDYCKTNPTLKENPHSKPRGKWERRNTDSEKRQEPISESTRRDTPKENWIAFFLVGYMSIQAILPFTHSITKGYNNWTDGVYGYSWDMMVYSWDTLHTEITVKDVILGEKRYLDPDTPAGEKDFQEILSFTSKRGRKCRVEFNSRCAPFVGTVKGDDGVKFEWTGTEAHVWTTNERWSSHADMAKQYAKCIERNLKKYNVTNIEVYFDVWKSLNGRFQQRVFDPRVDILLAPWSPWEKVPWIFPLLQEFSHWRRGVLQQISKDVANWTKSSNVIFVADYPGLTLENYLPPQLSNVSLTLMKGKIIIEQSNTKNVTLTSMEMDNLNFSLRQNRVSILTNALHKIHSVASSPSYYMYTYTNKTEDSIVEDKEKGDKDNTPLLLLVPNLITIFLQEKWNKFSRSFLLIVNSYLNLFFGIPMVLRKAV